MREGFGRSERARSQYALFAGPGFALGPLFLWPGARLPGSILLALARRLRPPRRAEGLGNF